MVARVSISLPLLFRRHRKLVNLNNKRKNHNPKYLKIKTIE